MSGCMLRNPTPLAPALTLAAGAILYVSDPDNLERHWRRALVMALSAALILMAPGRPSEAA
ncbi:MAG: hypothetical protein JWP01_1514 [Myxococcales bacterium]|nr:hypothetical protein [Myxococcales bacterium]